MIEISNVFNLIEKSVFIEIVLLAEICGVLFNNIRIAVLSFRIIVGYYFNEF